MPKRKSRSPAVTSRSNPPPDRPRTFLTPAAAAELAQVTPVTIRGWARRYGIGTKIGGRVRINPDALGRVLAGEVTR